MLRSSNRWYFLLIMSLLSLNLLGQSAIESEAVNESTKHHDLNQELSLRDEIDQDIEHHMQDAHSFDILHDKETGKKYGFPLPVILWDDGLKVFMSSEFEHGERLVEKGGQYYKLYHGKIYKTDAQGTIKYDEKHHPTNPEPLDFSITKNVFIIFFVSFLLVLMFGSLARGYKKSPIPTGLGRFLEPLVIYIRDEIAIPNIGKKKYKRYMSYLLTIFFFIWVMNVFGLMPFGINVTGNIAVTFTLALLTFLITNFTGNKTYWLHIFDPIGNTMPWFGKIFIYPILVPIEILGIFVKPFSLMIRLYANISAGHIVMMSLIGLIFVFRNLSGGSMSFFLAVMISFIEFFVAALQAYIFTTLSALYFGMANEEHHEEH